MTRAYRLLQLHEVYVTKLSPGNYLLARLECAASGMMLFLSPSMRTKECVRAYAETHQDHIFHCLWPDFFEAPAP
ncbi:hypothetical protein SAMN05216605_121138 [Pseudomonas abietaniphila]|uniref:Uncharacterized protein n=1 Tax=Pseudomonas abietaniphila TaxID=89065 RepID=A0A1G8R1Y9_9PSED|nr:hypothetical protein SAMN05216605_121138 [Pseudomonas abietaniphila]